jgi:RNA polymerase sigma-70 factor, ECF subfamily
MDGSTSLHAGAPMLDASRPDLVALAQLGDVEALGALYDTHYPVVYRYLRARVGDPHLAEDLASDVFRRMLTGLPQYRPMGLPFQAWLLRIAHNRLVDHYRQESSHMSVELETIENQGGDDADPTDLVERQLSLEQAYRALAKLDTAQRDVLILRFLNGLSLRDVSLALNRTEDSVKALQRRGLAALRLTVAQE